MMRDSKSPALVTWIGYLQRGSGVCAQMPDGHTTVEVSGGYDHFNN